MKRASWNYTTTEAEDVEADQLLKTIAVLRNSTGKELAGTSIYSLFIKRRV